MDDAELWQELRAAAAASAIAESALEMSQRRRDAAIIELARAGATRRAVADAAGVTPGRVQQILVATGDRSLLPRERQPV